MERIMNKENDCDPDVEAAVVEDPVDSQSNDEVVQVLR